MFGKSGRTDDARNAIVEVDASPARTYPTRQEANAARQQQAVRDEEMAQDLVGNYKDGEGLYRSHL